MSKMFRRKRIIVGISLGLMLVVIGFGGYFYTGMSNCTSVEKYDFIHDECYYECDTDAQCNALSKKVDAELNDEYQDSKLAGPAVLATGSDTKGTTYSVKSDGKITPSPSAEHAKLWELSKQIIGTEEASKNLASFEVFNDENNTTAASVWRTDNNPNKWHMNINEAFKDDRKDLVHTIVHEYAHVLTLSGTQVPEVKGSCPRFQLSEGCANPGSYVQSFHNRFWSQYGDNIPADDGSSQDDVAKFYSDKKDQFVTDYAATNPAEDMAESFAYFVLRPKPTNNEVRDQKINFYYQYAELVAMRTRMRAAIGADLLRQDR